MKADPVARQGQQAISVQAHIAQPCEARQARAGTRIVGSADKFRKAK